MAPAYWRLLRHIAESWRWLAAVQVKPPNPEVKKLWAAIMETGFSAPRQQSRLNADAAMPRLACLPGPCDLLDRWDRAGKVATSPTEQPALAESDLVEALLRSAKEHLPHCGAPQQQPPTE